MMTEEQRAAFREMIGRGKMGEVTELELDRYPAKEAEIRIETSLGSTAVYVYENCDSSTERPLVINFHGGGFIKGRNRRDELFCRKMANLLGAVVVDLDYHLAPEYPYPAAVKESWEVVRWSWEQRERLGFDQGKIVLIGHSAGGNLAAGVSMRLGESGLFRPACLVLDYPPLELAKDPAEKERTSCDMPAERAREYNRQYICPECSREPYASPVYAPERMLAGLPDTLVISAGEDSLCAEDEEFALRLARSGVTVTLRRFTDSLHGFVINRRCEWEAAEELIVRFIKQHVS